MRQTLSSLTQQLQVQLLHPVTKQIQALSDLTQHSATFSNQSQKEYTTWDGRLESFQPFQSTTQHQQLSTHIRQAEAAITKSPDSLQKADSLSSVVETSDIITVKAEKKKISTIT